MTGEALVPSEAPDHARLDLAQGLAAELLVQVLAGRSLDTVLAANETRLAALGRHLRSVCRDLCFGVLRHHGRLRALLQPLLRQKETDRRLLLLLEVAAYQLSETRSAPHAVVDHAVRAATQIMHPAVGKFVNAVLRSYLREQAELSRTARRSPEGRYSHPAWWVRRLQRDHPTQWRGILASAQEHPPLTLRVNRRRCSVPDYLAQLAGAGIAATPLARLGDLLACDAVQVLTPCPVERLPGFAEGLVSVQDAAAQFAALLLQPRDGDRVLDACAAPGGKSAHLLECADVDLLALDQDAQRLQRVDASLARLGLQARTQAADAALTETWWDGRPFDRILLDAPCTGSGVVRRHPDIRWLRRAGDPAQLALLQRRLAAGLWPTLKRGGTFLYVTCSLFSDEGPEFVQSFLAEHPDACHAAPAGAPFRDGWVIPDALHDGFFYALFTRR